MEILFIQTGGFTLQENEKDFFAMLAERDHTTVEKVKEKISKRIWEGLHGAPGAMGTDTMCRRCTHPGGMAALFCGTAERRWPGGFAAALPHRLGVCISKAEKYKI